MRKLLKNRWFRYPYMFFLYGFAAIGLFIAAVALAMKMGWTKEGGTIDRNDRHFAQMHNRYNQNFRVDSVSVEAHRYEVLERALVLNNFYPKNAKLILDAYMQHKDEKLALEMLDAVDIALRDNTSYRNALEKKIIQRSVKGEKTGLSAFDWMNTDEWKYFTSALVKDKKLVDSVEKLTGVEGRMIVCCLVGEQVRLFNSRRERFKDYVAPLKTLALETNLSYGVTGIKESTAEKIEYYLKDSASVYYLGSQYAHLLDYDTTRNYINNLNDTMSVRVQRLVQFNNHYYSYLYAALYIKQIRTQWLKAGYSIDDRPEILASLFNLGYRKSVPKANPSAGGSEFKIRDKSYTFGSVAFDFYYSGELEAWFPFRPKHFDFED